MALIYGLTQFRQYLLGRHIIVRTDHAPLLALTRSNKPSSQMCRWQDIIQDYNLEIQHRPGLRHGNADGLSRSICKQCNLSSDMYAEIDSSIVAANSNVHLYRLRAKDQVNSQTPNGLQDIARLQELDPHIGPIYKALCNKESEAPEWTDHLSSSANTKKYYDLKVKPRSYNIGDWVWMFSPRRKVGKYVKWQRQFSGPFLVVDVLGPVTYAIQKSMKAQNIDCAHGQTETVSW